MNEDAEAKVRQELTRIHEEIERIKKESENPIVAFMRVKAFVDSYIEEGREIRLRRLEAEVRELKKKAERI